jgi:TonB family protein
MEATVTPPVLRTPEPSAEPSPLPVAEETPVPEGVPSAAATVEPDQATLQIRSEPDGATVLIGRARRGTTPVRLKIAPGAVTVRVEKPGYKPWSSDARLKPGESRTLEAQLEPLAPPPTHAPPTPPPATPAVHAVREGDLVPITDDVTPPRRIKDSSPGSQHGKRGVVVVSFVVDIDGRVTDAKVVESGGDALDKASVEAVQKRRYEPATVHGTKVRVALSVKFEFK